MININDKNCYFLPNLNKNGLSLYSVENLFEDDFEIMVKFRVDWDSYTKDTSVGGVVSKNGKHMGIFTKKDWDGEKRINRIIAKIWTTSNGQEHLEELTFDVNDNLYECLLTHDFDSKTFTFKCNDEIKVYKYEGTICDYKNSWLWYGCSMGIGDEWNEHFYGTLYKSYISIKGGFKVFKSNFSKYTKYKVFDESYNGNHLIKYNEEYI